MISIMIESATLVQGQSHGYYFIFNRYLDSDRRFQHVLEACGVYKSLMKLGVKEGDTVIVGEVCHFFLLTVLLFIEILARTMNKHVVHC